MRKEYQDKSREELLVIKSMLEQSIEMKVQYITEITEKCKAEVTEQRKIISEKEKTIEYIDSLLKKMGDVSEMERRRAIRKANSLSEIPLSPLQMTEEQTFNLNVFIAIESIVADQIKYYNAVIVKFDGIESNRRFILDQTLGVRASQVKQFNEWLMGCIEKYHPACLWYKGDMGKVALKAVEEKGLMVAEAKDLTQLGLF